MGGPDKVGVLPLNTMLTTARAVALQDGKITPDEVQRLIALANDSTGDDSVGRQFISDLLTHHQDKFSGAEGLDRARQFVSGDHHSRPYLPPAGPVYRVENKNPEDFTTRNQKLWLQGEGRQRLETGIQGYSRGYGQMNQGVLNRVHGSAAPQSPHLDATARAALNRTPPGARLDQMAAAVGFPVGGMSFSAIAQAFYQPDQPDWGGVCYAWAWTALSERLSALVDVPGPEHQRGLWYQGQWMSRADLGNWLMVLASALSQGEGDVLWYAPDIEDAIKASLATLAPGGPGYRADLGTSLRLPGEIWFQPVVAADLTVRSLPASAEAEVLRRARADEILAYGMKRPGVEGNAVRLVEVKIDYGDETSDDHEGEPAQASVTWRGYAVLDAAGETLRILPADDARLSDIDDLPTRATDPAPNALFRPDHAVIDDLFNGTLDAQFDQRHLGAPLRFFCEHVLARGVPAVLRAQFENELARHPGPIDSATQNRWAEKYPGVARAYSAEQWAQHLAPRGLDRAKFGGE